MARLNDLFRDLTVGEALALNKAARVSSEEVSDVQSQSSDS